MHDLPKAGAAERIAAVVTTVARTSTREQRVVRVLFLMDRAGEPKGPGAPPETHRLMRGQMRLQALDFWLRNPDYLAYELLARFAKTAG